ncbi:hypothetical protein QT970_01565 [Microcoleus sp. herbarium8]|uniref:hypothetical protein n=1 Tax=Microcoleus sp. herbarium8 TaxID=3055436 RepID=UPI002FD6358D
MMIIQFSGCGDEEGKNFILAIARNTKYCDYCTECDRNSYNDRSTLVTISVSILHQMPR